jgi:hypothetical protein
MPLVVEAPNPHQAGSAFLGEIESALGTNRDVREANGMARAAPTAGRSDCVPNIFAVAASDAATLFEAIDIIDRLVGPSGERHW